MKIEKISENKIKIELLEKEITQWSMIADKQVPDYNAMMLDLITAAEKETGVSFHNCQVVVEATRSSNNTYVIYVTRGSGGMVPDSRHSAHRIKDKKFHPKTAAVCRIVAEFSDIEKICDFDRFYPFYGQLLSGNNTLYSFEGRYYLDITVPQQFSEYAHSLRGNLSEFSSSTAGTVIPYVLSEHARCVIKGNALLELRKINQFNI